MLLETRVKPALCHIGSAINLVTFCPRSLSCIRRVYFMFDTILEETICQQRTRASVLKTLGTFGRSVFLLVMLRHSLIKSVVSMQLGCLCVYGNGRFDNGYVSDSKSIFFIQC